MLHTSLHHRVEGSGPRLLLLHPVGLDLTFFDTLSAKLAPDFTVMRVDLPGFGRSPGYADSEAPTLADYAGRVHELLQEHASTPTAVAGFSMGGMVAQELALHFPEDVSALLICACGSTFSEETRSVLQERGATAERDGMAALVELTLTRWFTEAFRAKGLDADARERLLSDSVPAWKQAWNAIAQLDTAPRLKDLDVPTLCLAGSEDMSTPPAVVKALVERIPGAQYREIQGAPHMIFLEYAEQTAAILRGFLVGLA